MRKGLKWLSFSFIVVFIGALVISPIGIENDAATAGGSGPEWCDMYGFQYYWLSGSANVDTWKAKRHYSEWNSDIYENWNVYDPSAHWSRCNTPPPWPGSAYKNATYAWPHAYLDGNAMFVFRGHANRHVLQFRHPNGTSRGSYVIDHPSNANGYPATYISNHNIDYMYFAYLGGCKTAQNNPNYPYGNDGHLAWWFRCARGADCVLGFKESINLKQGAEFTEQFFVHAINFGTSINYAANRAYQITRDVFGGDAGFVWSREVWGFGGRTLRNPDWGIYEGF